MSSSRSGTFFRLHWTSEAPPELEALPLVSRTPPVLFVPEDAWLPGEQDPLGGAELMGTAISGDGSVRRLLSIPEHGPAQVDFDIAGTIEAILLERFTALVPTIEMKLPFNYSRVPPVVKSVARTLLRGRQAQGPGIDFPSADPGFVVDWLQDLAAQSGRPQSRRLPLRGWPEGRKAALVVTHDVDTAWILRRRAWLDRMVTLEERFGVRGAWYCVPMNSRGRRATASLERLRERQCEIGCHGFNHDAKWPLLSGSAFEERLDAVKRFADQWEMRGFRSEWLWRTPDFLKRLAPVFEYDTSVPSHSSYFSSPSGNGSATGFPYFTWGGLLELPLTLPMDDARHVVGMAPGPFWDQQTALAERIADQGGMVHLSLHPQPHQAANEETLSAFEKTLERLTDRGDLWLATPAEVADWTMRGAATGRQDGRSGEAERAVS